MTSLTTLLIGFKDVIAKHTILGVHINKNIIYGEAAYPSITAIYQNFIINYDDRHRCCA